MRLPTYDEISRDEQQLDIYDAPFDQSMLVTGPPGSGKTVLAVHRAQMATKAGITVVFVTYNRMLRRLVALLTAGKIQARTMHKFVSDNYYKDFNAKVPSKAPYVYDWQAMFVALKEHGVQPAPIHVIVDEGQDLPKEFFCYLREFGATTLTVFADEDQALTEDRSTLLDIKTTGRFDDPILLTGNHRNTPEIARVAEHFHSGQSPIPEVHRPPSGELPKLLAYSTIEKASALVANWYSGRGGSVGVVVARNPTGQVMYKALREQLQGHRVDFYQSDNRNEGRIDLLRPGVTILNEKSVKGQEFDTVFVMELNKLLASANDATRRVLYMLCARARDNLLLMHESHHLPHSLAVQLPNANILERP